MTDQYERDMIEKMLELASVSENCLLHQNSPEFNLSRSIKRKSKPKKPKGAKYFYKK